MSVGVLVHVHLLLGWRVRLPGPKVVAPSGGGATAFPGSLEESVTTDDSCLMSKRDSAVSRAKPKQLVSENEKKWSKDLMDAGWTALPSIILEHQHSLGIDSTDLVIILQIAKHWWTADNAPRPGKRLIARAMGINPRNVQRRLNRLVEEGLLEKKPGFRSDGGNRGNDYTFKGLIKKVSGFAKAKLADIAARKRSDGERLRRKKPQLSVVRG